MSIENLDIGFAMLINGIQHASFVVCVTFLHLTTSDSGNLTTTENAVTDDATPYRDIGFVYTTVVIVTAAEDVATV